MSAGNHHNGRYGASGSSNGHSSSNGHGPDQLSERMSRVRRDLERDVEKLSDDARQVTDWRYLVKRHPYAAAGLAALVGYSLVPGKKQIVTASRSDIESLVRAGKLQIVADGQGAQKAGLLSTSLLAVGTVAARAVMAYAGKRIGEKLDSSGSAFGPAPSE
ncbi:hypothetical protein Pla123a_38990 [Posidoniimonas polymericola]|uniref:DUF3618 domain-containing protein n=1 Tax=Posidoniimonas polymericola TaxID=2528002 RepID=A0A5C5YFI7_9BACT|nr:hypothetical protein [Posidoniimonas polymericola]TWT73563.1 hypothetical protein Pla123a_38990 [Posidoniimonas polymericola]